MPVIPFPNRLRPPPRDEAVFDLAEHLRQSAEVWASLSLLVDAMLQRRGVAS